MAGIGIVVISGADVVEVVVLGVHHGLVVVGGLVVLLVVVVVLVVVVGGFLVEVELSGDHQTVEVVGRAVVGLLELSGFQLGQVVLVC